MVRGSMTKEEVLIEALPYISTYEGKTFVVKYGGAAMSEDSLKRTFAQDVTLLKKIGIRLIIVHGGGKEITAMLDRLGVATRFVDGQRYTDQESLAVVEMVLAGKINKEIVSLINEVDGGAIGLSGIDGGLLEADHVDREKLGAVGNVRTVRSDLLRGMLDRNWMPVIATLGVTPSGEHLNINADYAAAAIAAALDAEKLVYISDVPGVIKDGTLVPTLTESEAEELIAAGVITDGMIPKIQTAFKTVGAGVRKVHMIDGRVPHSLLLEIFTSEGIGTQFIRATTQEEA
ncbi:MAG: acetylglutamate kinase [Ignavibacteriales bacterium CG07_land_8_20_14_0_80_59_12]|nr:MAG: acetylglutamate kinase [Ignavibacteriales bacterium CG07_land_8_20_14_0_80_59_12]